MYARIVGYCITRLYHRFQTSQRSIAVKEKQMFPKILWRAKQIYICESGIEWGNAIRSGEPERETLVHANNVIPFVGWIAGYQGQESSWPKTSLVVNSHNFRGRHACGKFCASHPDISCTQPGTFRCDGNMPLCGCFINTYREFCNLLMVAWDGGRRLTLASGPYNAPQVCIFIVM